VAAPEVLQERQPGDDHPGGVVAAHRSQSVFEPAMVGLDPIVRVPFDMVPSCRGQFVDDLRIDRPPRRPARWVALFKVVNAAEEPASGVRVSPGETRTSMSCPCWSTASVDVAPHALTLT
jgi:hypothetical protein